MIKALILEDEVASKNYLIKLLNKSSVEVQVLDTLSSIESALKWFQNNVIPDIIFMDIHLSDGNSFKIFETINLKTPVVFVTAYDKYAIQAFKTTGIDYLLKPISFSDLENSFKKYFENRLIFSGDYGYNLSNLVHKPKEFKERFLVKKGNQYISIKTNEIAYFFRMDKYIFTKLFDGCSYIIKLSLNQVEEVLSPSMFIRLNRTVIANINSIESLRVENKLYKVTLTPIYKDEIRVSKERYRDVKKFLS